MSLISTDSIVPRHGTKTNVDALSLGGGSILANYNREAFQSGVSGPFATAGEETNQATGVITLMDNVVTLFMNTFTFTATADASNVSPLILANTIPAVYRPEITDSKAAAAVTNLIMGGVASLSPFTPLYIKVDKDGEVTYGPAYLGSGEISTGGFCTTEGVVILPSCSVSWPINLPTYIA